MKTWSAFIVATLGGILITGCKPMAQSDLQTLDNFAAGKRVSVNSCKAPAELIESADRNYLRDRIEADFQSRVSVETLKAMKEVARVVATAIPGVLQLQFIALGGRVIITDKSNKICTRSITQALNGQQLNAKIEQNRVLQEAEKSLKYCFDFNPATESIPQDLVIYLPPEREEIEHGLVRTFGYVVAEFYSRLRKTSSKPLGYGWHPVERQEFFAAKQRIKQAFMSVADTKGFTKFRDYRPDGAASAEAKDAMRDWIFAESFDSWFCNQKTRRKMQSEFGPVYQEFARFIGASGSDFKLTDDASQTGEQGKSLSLAGTEDYSSPWWAGTKAFFGSLKDNTYGKAKAAYGAYSTAVKNRVDEVYRPGQSIIGTASKAAFDVVSDGTGYTKYREDVRRHVDRAYSSSPSGGVLGAAGAGLGNVAVEYYGDYQKRVQEDVDARFEVQSRLGYSTNTSAANAFLGSFGSNFGATQGFEAVRGWDTKTGNKLSAEERAYKVSEGAFIASGWVGGLGAARNFARNGLRGSASAADDLARAGRSSLDDASRAVKAACLTGDCAGAKRLYEAAKQRLTAQKEVIDEAAKAWRASPLEKVSPFDEKRFTESVTRNLANNSNPFRGKVKVPSTAVREELQRATQTYSRQVGEPLSIGYKKQGLFATGGIDPRTGKSITGRLGTTSDRYMSIVPEKELGKTYVSKPNAFRQEVPLDVINAAKDVIRQ